MTDEQTCPTCEGKQLYRLVDPTEDEVDLSDPVPCPACNEEGAI